MGKVSLTIYFTINLTYCLDIFGQAVKSSYNIPCSEQLRKYCGPSHVACWRLVSRTLPVFPGRVILSSGFHHQPLGSTTLWMFLHPYYPLGYPMESQAVVGHNMSPECPTGVGSRSYCSLDQFLAAKSVRWLPLSSRESLRWCPQHWKQEHHGGRQRVSGGTKNSPLFLMFLILAVMSLPLLYRS